MFGNDLLAVYKVLVAAAGLAGNTKPPTPAFSVPVLGGFRKIIAAPGAKFCKDVINCWFAKVKNTLGEVVWSNSIHGRDPSFLSSYTGVFQYRYGNYSNGTPILPQSYLSRGFIALLSCVFPFASSS